MQRDAKNRSLNETPAVVAAVDDDKMQTGLAHEQCEVIDEIWVVRDCSIPNILSPIHENQENTTNVKGKALLDNFMFVKFLRALQEMSRALTE